MFQSSFTIAAHYCITIKKVEELWRVENNPNQTKILAWRKNFSFILQFAQSQTRIKAGILLNNRLSTINTLRDLPIIQQLCTRVWGYLLWNFAMFLKDVSYSYKDLIYLIKNTDESVMLWLEMHRLYFSWPIPISIFIGNCDLPI